MTKLPSVAQLGKAPFSLANTINCRSGHVMRKKRPVFAIIRVDESHGPEATIETRVTVKEVVATQEVAEREVERLTRINGAKGCRYYCQSTRFVEILENPGIAKDGNGGSMG